MPCYGYRFYKPDLGRWVNRDPIGEQGFELLRGKVANVMGDGPNNYSFVANNSLLLIDYLGLACGPGTIGNILVPDGIPGLYNFNSCCQDHDDCYAEQELSRLECDVEFRECMFAHCETRRLERCCRFFARVYYNAVRLGGALFY